MQCKSLTEHNFSIEIVKDIYRQQLKKEILKYFYYLIELDYLFPFRNRKVQSYNYSASVTTNIIIITSFTTLTLNTFDLDNLYDIWKDVVT